MIPVIIYYIILLLAIAFISVNIIVVLKIDQIRRSVGRRQLNTERLLKFRICLNICLNVIYYYNMGNIILYNYFSHFSLFSFSHSNYQMTVLVLDLILLLRSSSTAILLTLATKSAANIMKGLIGFQQKHSKLSKEIFLNKSV